MPERVAEWLDPEAARLRRISELGDFRPGSINTTTGRSGNPHCHCHRPGVAGHGPNFRLPDEAQGQTITEPFPLPRGGKKPKVKSRSIAAGSR